MNDTPLDIIEGHIAVDAVLGGAQRDVAAVYIDRKKKDQHTRKLARLAEQAGASVQRIPRADLDDVCGNPNHGGVAAKVGPRKYQSLDQLGSRAKTPLVVMLDGVEDPYNFGHAVRALYAAGASGLVLRKRNWSTAAGTVIRASAGATERIATAVVDEPVEAATHFRGRGFTVAATSKGKGAVSLYDADLAGAMFLLIGGEKRGVQRSFLEAADQLLYIPYGRRFDYSIGSVGAAAVFAFEIMRRRGGDK